MLKLQTFEEFILNNFVLKDAFLHIGKLDDTLLCALSECSNALGMCFDWFGVVVRVQCLLFM